MKSNFNNKLLFKFPQFQYILTNFILYKRLQIERKDFKRKNKAFNMCKHADRGNKVSKWLLYKDGCKKAFDIARAKVQNIYQAR